MNELGKMMIYAGIILTVIGCLVYFGGQFIPLGRLPGDFKWETSGFGIYFPLASSIIISILLTVLINVFFRR